MSTLIKIEAGSCKYITSNDQCFYFMEYHARQGYHYSLENSLIFNFKKSLNDKGQIHKKHAINEAAQLICSLLTGKMSNPKNSYVFVPIPTSKSKSDPDHDNRLIQVLQIVQNTTQIPYYDILDRPSTKPLHQDSTERKPEMHQFNFNHDYLDQLQNKTLILFDDVITSGSTFKAAQTLIDKYLKCTIIGLFIAKAM